MDAIENARLDNAPDGAEPAAASPLDRSLWDPRALDWERALFAAIVLLAFVSRFWDLGARALHHDESLHAYYSYNLFVGRGYVHDPLLHGTFLYHFNALIYFLFGASDATARYAPALLGTLTVGLPYFLRRQLGAAGALIASALLLISPSFLYFGRFIREDAHITFLLLAMVVCFWRYLDERRPLYLYVLAGFLALSFNVKESTYITMAIFGSYLLLLAGQELLQLLRRERVFSARGDLLVVLGTLTLTQMGGFAILYRHWQGLTIDFYPSQDDYRLLAVVFVALLAVAAAVGLRWRPRVWLISASVFFTLFAFFFTTMFSNPAGFMSGAVGGLVYWLAQQDVKRGGQPWHYYLVLLPLYEYLLLAFALPGAVYFLGKRRPFANFVLWWLILALVIYSWAGEKMPWLVLQLATPLALLAALTLAELVESQRWRERGANRAWLVGGAVLLLFAGLALASAPRPSGLGLGDLQSQYVWLRWVLMIAVLAGLAYFVLRQADLLGARRALATLAVGSLVVLVPLTVHTGVQAAFTNGDVAREMIVYTQTTPDVAHVMAELERLGDRTGQGKDLRVAYDSDVSWPFEWYLRDWRGRAFYGTGLPPTDAAVVLVGLESNHDAQVRPQLAAKYVSQRYKLRWWFPEDYRSPEEAIRALTPEAKRAGLNLNPSELGFGDVLRAALSSDGRGRLWRYFLYREPFNPLGSTDFVVYVRKDLAGGFWLPAQAANTAPATADPLEGKVRELAASRQYGPPTALGALREPRNLALAAEGGYYVLDAGNNRVVRFDAGGQAVAQWGSSGEGEGQFRDPWGLAVDRQGNVYVADTWNHRVQKFDAGGKFLLQWGGFADARSQPGSAAGRFYGPRAVAAAPDGTILVMDTGNKRLQKFSADGTFLKQVGGEGTAPGQFREPVGLSVDVGGSVWVADTWNGRVQEFDSELLPIAEWQVAGWGSETAANKPYLTADAQGNVYVGDPELHRVYKFSADGEVLAAWGRYGADASSLNLPYGLAVDAQGNVWVADAGNNRVLVFPPLP